ncbi:MAG: ATP-dependent RNA helicase HrpA, partial [Thiothrix sp.]
VENSDFLSFLKLWDYFHEQRKHLSQRKLRELCQKEFLSFVRLREWHDIHTQLQQLLAEMGANLNTSPAGEDAIHLSLLTGLLSNIGQKELEREYVGAHGRKFHLFPASNLKKKAPQWVMAAELVETSRLYARTVAKIQPEWVEQLGAHLLRRHYSEPHWEQKPAQVAAFERTTLYGITITQRRKVNYSRIDPALCRELFIRHALVYGEYRSDAPFFRHNAQMIAEIEILEAKGRRRDILADEQRLFDFYAVRLPAQVVNGHSFERWRRQAERTNPYLLFLQASDLMERDAAHERSNLFPDHLQVQGIALPLHYHFDPQAADDGVTVHIPLLGLNQLETTRFDYLVPGMLAEKITAMIRALPKAIRKQFVPAPDYAQACSEAIQPSDTVPLQTAVTQQLLRMTGYQIPTEAWAAVNLPLHLQMNFAIVDDSGNVIARGRDLAALKGKVRQHTRQQLAVSPAPSLERSGLTTWDFGDLPDTYWLATGATRLRTWPALVDRGSSVDIRLFDNEAEANAQHWRGVLRLLLLTLSSEARALPKHIPNMTTLCLQYAATGKCEELKSSIIRYVFQQTFKDHLTSRTHADFQQALNTCRQQLFPQAQEISRLLTPTLALYHEIRKQLKGKMQPAWLEALHDIHAQLGHLVYVGFLDRLDPEALRHFPRYLKGIQRRLQKLAANPSRDRALYLQLQPYWEQWQNQQAAQARQHADEASDTLLQEYHWLLEEFRISLFAQELGTARSVS